MRTYTYTQKLDNALSTDICRKAKCEPGKRRKRFFDRGGLYLEVFPSGRKVWFHKFYIWPNGERKEKRMYLGKFPDVSLQDARKKRDFNRSILAQGENPMTAKRSSSPARKQAPVAVIETPAPKQEKVAPSAMPIPWFTFPFAMFFPQQRAA